MDKRCDILIMTASFGNGHHSATKALIENLDHLFPDTVVMSEDLLAIADPKLKETFSEIYNMFTRSKLPLYNGFYNLRNSKENVIDDIALKLYYKKVDAYIEQLDPKMIISVFPSCAHFAAHYKHNYNPNLKMVTVITDVVGNWEWIHPDTDMYFVPSKDVKIELSKKGVKEENIMVTGVPVKRDFGVCVRENKEVKKVLIMASSMETIKFSAKILAEIGKMPYDFTIVTGKNEALKQSLKFVIIPENVKVLGFTDDIASLMKESDLIVTKPGGATIFEAIESGLPMLIKSSGVGQETYNEEFIYRYGLGDSFEQNHELFSKISSLLGNEKYSERIVENINQFKRTLDRSGAYLRLKQMISPQTMDAAL